MAVAMIEILFRNVYLMLTSSPLSSLHLESTHRTSYWLFYKKNNFSIVNTMFIELNLKCTIRWNLLFFSYNERKWAISR
jgi:hypothetical protein